MERHVQLPAHTVTFLALDVTFSYSALTTFQTWTEACETVREKSLILANLHGGVLIDHRSSSREMVFAFSRATSALNAILDLQVWTLDEAGPETNPPRIRAAIHTGELDDPNFSGGASVLDQALGIKNLAYAHQILLSLGAQDIVRARLDSSIGFKDLGSHLVQNEARPEKLFQVLHPRLPGEFPPIRSLDSALTNVVAEPGFVGRLRELFELAVKVRTCKVVTLQGPAGIGKSTLARQLGSTLVHEYADGVFVVDFGELTEPRFVAEVLASELPFVGAVGVDLMQHLRRELNRRQMLLILDNCDSCCEQIQRFVEEVLLNLRSVEVIITSRQPLGSPTERIYSVGPLDYSAGFSDSLLLLLRRAKELIPGFRLEREDVPFAEEICQTLRGIPLAIELTTQQLKAHTLRETYNTVLALASDPRGARKDDLQRIVEAVCATAYSALSDSEASVFRRSSIFVAGWDEKTGPVVLSDDRLRSEDVIDSANGLVDKGLMVHVKSAHSGSWYMLPRSLRQYAYSLSRQEDDLESLQGRYLGSYCELADAALQDLVGRECQTCITKLEREKPNLRVAIEWALQKDLRDEAYRLILGVHMFWYRRGYITEGRVWLERLLVACPHEVSERRGRALNIFGVFLNQAGETANAISYLERAENVAKELNNVPLTAAALGNQAVAARGEGESARAISILYEAAKLLRESGDKTRLAMVTINLGGALSESGRFEEAEAVLDESLSINSDIGNEPMVHNVKFNLASLYTRRKQLDKAQPLLVQCLMIWSSSRDYHQVSIVLNWMARIANSLGQSERAAVLLGSAAAFRDRVHYVLPLVERRSHEELVGQLTGAIGDGTFFRKWNEGNQFSLDEAVSFALGRSDVSV